MLVIFELYRVFDIIWENNHRFPSHPSPLFLFLSIYMCLFILKYWNLMGSLWQFIQGCPSQLATMIYIAIGAFYLTTEQLKNSPSKKDDIDVGMAVLWAIRVTRLTPPLLGQVWAGDNQGWNGFGKIFKTWIGWDGFYTNPPHPAPPRPTKLQI